MVVSAEVLEDFHLLHYLRGIYNTDFGLILESANQRLALPKM